MPDPSKLPERSRAAAWRFFHWVSRRLARPDTMLTAVAMVVGAVTGLGALAFSFLIEAVTHLYFDLVGPMAAVGTSWWLLLLPTSGALLTGLIIYYFAPEAEGHGVPEVMDAMARKGGRIRPRVAGAKAVASSLTIGSGGSAGTEGPIIQIGAAIGSGFGQWLRVSLNDIRVMIGCGAAAGIASIFNAPIAGVLFAVEVLLRDITLRNFVPIIISAVLSSTVTQAYRGHNEAIFPVAPAMFGAGPVYEFTVREFGNYLLLGILCGLVAVSFVKLLYASEDLFRKLPVHRILRPVVGGGLLALLTLGSGALVENQMPGGAGELTTPTITQETHIPAIMGNGYPVIEKSLDPRAYGESPAWTVQVLLLLLVCKVLATCFTLGSGGSGGVFAPSLFIGAVVGGAFGLLVQQIPFFADTSPGAYALVGMAAVVASSIHAPLTATLILFELTRDYKVVIPIMTAAVAGLAVAQWIEPASIYTLKLIRRGVRLASGDLRTLQRIAVRDIHRARAHVVTPDDPVDKLVRLMRTTTAQDFLVVDKSGRLTGMVVGDDVRMMLLEAEAMPLLTVSDVMREDFPTVQPHETLDVVLDKFAGWPMHSIPVVGGGRQNAADAELLTRAAVMNRYHQALAGVGHEPAGTSVRH